MGCARCGAPTKVFTSSGRAAKFCEGHGEKKAKPVKVLPERACQGCSAQFVPSHGSQKFCSAACRSGSKVRKSARTDPASHKKAGQPPHVPTPALRKKVAAAAGGGMHHEEIALGLGISKTTLEKYYAYEISTGAYAKRLEVLNAMHRAAKKGNVAAQKAYLALDPKLAVPPLQTDGAAPEPKAPVVGKKEQAAADAVTAGQGDEWGDILRPPAPKVPVH